MKKVALLSGLLFLVFCSNAFAHALWVETAGTGKKGQAQEVRVFFGEFSDKSITPTERWFSDTRSFSLVLITPDNKEIRLTPTQQKEYFSANFTPESDGVYLVILHHMVKDVYHGNRLDYHSSAQVRVGTGNTQPSYSFNIGVQPDSKGAFTEGQPVLFTAYLDNKPAAKTEVEVVAPNGWSKKLYTDSTGKAVFTPIWPGGYNVEITRSEKKTGEHQGKPYETEWRGASCIVDIRKK